MIRMAILAGVTAALCGCGATLPDAPSFLKARTTAPCAVQSLACFYFEGTLSVGLRSVEVGGWSQDMPTPGFENRWHYLLSPPAAGLLGPFRVPLKGWMGGAAVVWPDGRGGMYMLAQDGPGGPAHWRLDMRPTDATVSEDFAKVARSGEFEEWRAQTFVARPLGSHGEAEILITEPALPARR